MPKTVTIEPPKEGDILFDVEEKIFPDYKANEGDKAYVFMHTVPFEGSVGLVNMLTATRLQRKGFELTFILYGPGVLMASAARGYPAVGNEGFPGNLGYNKQLRTLIDEGAKVYACRFAMGALYAPRLTQGNGSTPWTCSTPTSRPGVSGPSSSRPGRSSRDEPVDPN